MQNKEILSTYIILEDNPKFLSCEFLSQVIGKWAISNEKNHFNLEKKPNTMSTSHLSSMSTAILILITDFICCD